MSAEHKKDHEPTGHRYTLGLIGMGVSGMNQIAAVTDRRPRVETGFRLLAVSDLNPKFTAPEVQFYRNYQDLLRRSEIQAVSIVTPPSTHLDIAMDALRAGKHVLVEKPPTLTIADSETLMREAQERGKSLFFSYHYRYHPLMLAVTRELSGRNISDIEITINQNAFENHAPNGWTFNPAIAGGGTLMDDGINFLGVIPQVLGQTPEFAITNTNFTFAQGMQVETAADVDFRFGQQGSGTVKLDWMNDEQPERKIAFVADGTKYTVDLRNNLFYSDDRVFMDMGHTRGDRDKIIEYEGAYADFAQQITSEVLTSEFATSIWPLDFVMKAYAHAGLNYSQS